MYNFDAVFTNIEGHRTEYPDAKQLEANNRFKTLDEYLTIAKKVIRTFAPKFLSKIDVNRMINSETAISEIARHLMTADWKYDKNKNRTEYSYRNQCGLWAIQTYLKSFKNIASKEHPSLDKPITTNENSTLLTFFQDESSEESSEVAERLERKERIGKYIKFLMDNSKLSPVQAQCVKLRYINEIDSYAEIGKLCNPKLSRQAVKQAIDRGLFRLKQTALGTTNKNKKEH